MRIRFVEFGVQSACDPYLFADQFTIIKVVLKTFFVSIRTEGRLVGDRAVRDENIADFCYLRSLNYIIRGIICYCGRITFNLRFRIGNRVWIHIGWNEKRIAIFGDYLKVSFAVFFDV